MAKATIQLPFTSLQFRTIWDEWKQYRYEELKKPPYKKAGLNRAFNQLIRLSNNNEGDAIKIIIATMDNGWQGFHPIPEIQTNEQKKSDFYNKLKAHKEKETLYPPQLYKEFFDYWTKEDSITNKLAFEKVVVFNFSDRLKNWYDKMDKEKLSEMWKSQPTKNYQLFKSE